VGRPARRALRWLVPVFVLLVVGAAAVAVALRSDPDGDPATGAAHVRVDGNRLVDARSDRTFVPRGVNWSSFEYACAQGWGYSALDTMLGQDPYTAEATAIARRNTRPARRTSAWASSGWSRNQQSYTETTRGRRLGGTT